MAGLYPDSPSRRMAYDTDGTVGLMVKNKSATTFISALDMAEMNDENYNTYMLIPDGDFTTFYPTWYFPELREIDGHYLNFNVAAGWGVGASASSADTTNGTDGTWNTIDATAIYTTSSSATDHRSSITSKAIATERAFRLTIWDDNYDDAWLRRIHLYGVISPGETPDRILFLDTDAADAVFTKVLDFGEVPRGQTQTRTIKLKNNSATLTINTVQITAEDLYLNAGDWYTFGDDGISYQATFAVGNMGPAATQLIYLKQAVPDAETLSVQTGRIRVSHASLT